MRCTEHFSIGQPVYFVSPQEREAAVGVYMGSPRAHRHFVLYLDEILRCGGDQIIIETTGLVATMKALPPVLFAIYLNLLQRPEFLRVIGQHQQAFSTPSPA